LSQRSWLSDFRVSIRFVSLLFGLALIILSVFLIASILESSTAFGAGASAGQFVSFYELILFLSILAGGVTLVHSVTRSIRIRVPSSMFLRMPKLSGKEPHRYGFLAALSLGLGATIGSPLFVLIPLNVVQYGFISIASLLIAASISLLVARLYGRMYREWDAKGKECVGGPAFTRNACGRSSLRYFIARFGLWIGNTALASYSVIIFVNYSRFDLAATLQSFVGPGATGEIVALSLIGLLVAWFAVNAFFEKRYARAIAVAQIGLTILLCGILLFESASLLQTGVKPITSLFSLPGGDVSTIVFALVANTAFLFLLFFGFQEIQAMSLDLAPKSSIPGLSVFKRFRDLDRVSFAQKAMLLSVVIATIINVVYAIGVYVAVPNGSGLSGSSVPAIYVAQSLFGPANALLMGIGFVIASLTTFVPSFLSSSRHLRALSADGFFPKSVGSSAWLFSLVFMMVLSLFNADFLVRITDFGVLVALAFVSFSALWSRKPSLLTPRRPDFLPGLTGIGCLLVAAALYFVDPNVVLFGIIFIMIGYLLFDIFELGSYGSQIFLAVLYIVLFGVTGIIAKSNSVTVSASTIVSLRLMQNVLEAAIAMFAINIVIGTRFYQHLGSFVSGFALKTRTAGRSLSSRIRRLRKGTELDHTIDRWIRLMEDSDRISSQDPDNFILVKRYLEDKLSFLRRDRKTPSEGPSPAS
jgi:amino acid transporter